MIANLIVITTTLVLSLLLFYKSVEKSSWWSATVIPLWERVILVAVRFLRQLNHKITLQQEDPVILGQKNA